jgi:hypothetical protein
MRWQARRAAVPEGQVCLTEVEEYSIVSTSLSLSAMSFPVLSCMGQGMGMFGRRALAAVGSQAAWPRQGHGTGI